jgi:Bacterial RNA polymerase, alpha chain C terminal domain
MAYGHDLNHYVFFPTWLPLHQRELFRDRAVKAFARAVAIHGPEVLADVRTRRRIIGGLAAAFRTGRVGAAAWGRSMLGKRGGDALWRTVQALAHNEGDPNTVIVRAVEEYVTATAKQRGHRTGNERKLAKVLSTPVADLHLSARSAAALKMLNIQCVYELVQKSPLDLFRLPNVGENSLREVKEKLATLG